MKPIATLRKLHKRQRGAVAIMVGLSIFVLIAFLGMTVDLGHLFITKTELSNAADACSLAAAAELNGASDALDRAESAGITVGQRNKVGFQGSAVVILPNSHIMFSANLQGPYYLKTNPSAIPANMKYAKCELPQTGILPYFMQVVGFGPQQVTSHAVATLAPGITNCGLPVAMCKKPSGTCTDPITGAVTARDAMGLCKKQWYCSKLGATSSDPVCGSGINGAFNLVGYSGTSPNPNELAPLITGAGQCNLQIGSPATGTGEMQVLSQAWNTRFGLYMGSDNISNATPDFSGFAYTATSWPSQYNAFKGTLTGTDNFETARLNNNVYQGDSASGLSTNYITNKSAIGVTGVAKLRASGADRRVAVVPIVDCSTWGPSHTVSIEQFACIVMLHPWESNPNKPLYLEYQGLSDLPGSPCSTTGLPGGPGSVGPRVPALVR